MLIAVCLFLTAITATYPCTASQATEPNEDILIVNTTIYHPEIYSPNYIDPVRQQVKDMKAKGLNETVIVKKLKEQNIIYWPEKDEWAKGTELTPEELKNYQLHIDKLNKQYGFTSNNKTVQVKTISSDEINQVDDMLKTPDSDFTYTGWVGAMKPGSVAVANSKYGGSFQHIITTHLGGQGSVIEIGVIRSYDIQSYNVVTFQGNIDGTPVHYRTVNPEDWHNYEILVTTNHNSQGYLYYVYFDGSQVRSGRLNSLNNQVTQNNENWKYTTAPSFSVDTSHAVYNIQSLAKNGNSNFFPWNSTIPYASSNDYYATYPQHQILDDQGWNPHNWYHESWTQY